MVLMIKDNIVKIMCNIFLIFIILFAQTFSEETFPLRDDILFRINWPGKIDNINKLGLPNQEYKTDESFIITSHNNEKYSCTAPSSVLSEPENSKSSENFKPPHETLSGLFKSGTCTYRIESYWTYELCHGVHIRQYHEERIRTPDSDGSNPTTTKLSLQDGKFVIQPEGNSRNDAIKVTEYFLGYMKDQINKDGILKNPETAPKSPSDIPYKTKDGIKMPYFAVEMKNGTPCDLKMGYERQSKVLYICDPSSHNEIMSVMETSSCLYEIQVHTPALCVNPMYKVDGSTINDIQCVPMLNSPNKPISISELQLAQSKEIFSAPKQKEIVERVQPKFDTSKQTAISKSVDANLLKEFLSGDYCLTGGSGWWRFEFCYGKQVKQYHEDVKLGRTTIILGMWDKDIHKSWATEKGSKPQTNIFNNKGESKVQTVQHMYSNGDICDATGLPRKVIVRMKCKSDTKSPHSVTIYLLEPSTCSYILGVESLIICDLLETADEYGLLNEN